MLILRFIGAICEDDDDEELVDAEFEFDKEAAIFDEVVLLEVLVLGFED